MHSLRNFTSDLWKMCCLCKGVKQEKERHVIDKKGFNIEEAKGLPRIKGDTKLNSLEGRYSLFLQSKD